MFGVPWNGDTIQPPDVRPFSLSPSLRPPAKARNTDEQVL